MRKLFLVLTAIVLSIGIAACGKKKDPPVLEDPVINGAANVSIDVGDTFDPMAGVTATDKEDGNLTSSITVTGTVDTTTAGTYQLTYSVTDSDEGTTTVTRTVFVSVALANGFYNFKFADTDIRHTFMAAAEKYMMNNMHGGVPLFADGTYMLYSDRMQLPVDNYVPIMQYGAEFGTMSADDSTVKMEDGQYGNAGEYTYRSTIGNNPEVFNHWLYDAETDGIVIGRFTDALYVYEFNADKTGYVVVPSMAAEDPNPIDSHLTDTGKLVSKKWQITLRDDLEWTYHVNTDISNFPDGHEVIDANDFVDTYQLALEEEWFRAVAGGGDFLNENTGIKNAQEFVDGEVSFDQVGIKKIDDLTIEFEFLNDMSDWNVRYWLSSFVMTPIHTDLYNEIGEQYGTSEDTVAFNGAYVLDYYEPDKILRYSQNPNYHSPNDFFYTGYTYSIIEDNDMVFQEYLAGKLERVGLPATKYDEHKTDAGIKQVPGTTTYRMMINGLGTVEAQQEQFPNSTYVPEPILANHNFKMAMFHVIDRQSLAEEVLKTRTTTMYYFSDAYLVDAELGIPYRLTDQGELAGEGLSPSTHGYNVDAAVAYWQLAIDALIADGTYEAGTASNPTIIELNFNIFSGSESQGLMGAYIETAFEDAFNDEENHIEVDVIVHPKDYPNIYYDYMMVGNFDLSIGGIGGSVLDAAGFLDVFCSDNRSGFTLNWGIDTSQPEIEVVYTDTDGDTITEMWSYDAIYSALNGEVYLVDGAEAEVPAAKDFEYTPTSITFTIDKFASTKYTDITYTIEKYNFSTEAFEGVTGLIDVTPDSATVTVNDLEPSGYYQVVIDYTYTADGEKTGSSTSPYEQLPNIFAVGTVTPDLESATFDITIHEGYTETISLVKVYDAEGNEVTNAVVNYDDLTAISVTGLATNAIYSVTFTFSDDNEQSVDFTTKEILEAGEITLTPTSAAFTVTVPEGYVAGIIDTIKVYDVDGEEVTTAVVDNTNLAISITVLVPETDYTVTFTFTDGSNEQSIDFTTEAILEIGEITLTSTSATFGVTVNGDYTGTITTVKVYDADEVEVTTADVDFTDLAAVSIAELVAETDYTVIFTFDDGNEQSIEFTTEATE